MHPSKPRICLSMIVKDEAHVLARCLASVKPYIAAWAICDTGSTDGTQELIRRELDSLPGMLLQDAWVDFGTNRTHALELAQASDCDYILVIDADETLVVVDPAVFDSLTADAYRIDMRHMDGIAWPRINLLRSGLQWRYVGIIHEHAIANPPVEETRLAGAYMWTDGDGARGRDPDKALHDLAVMLRSVDQEPDNSRYWFYLAQGYEVAQQVENAISAYEKRAHMGDNPDEVWFSRYRTAQLMVMQNKWHEAIVRYLAAYQLDPTRAEPLFWLATGYINRGQDAIAMVFLDAIASLPKPDGAMFVEEKVYDYLRWTQYAATASNLGRHEDALDIASRLLASGKAPESYNALLDQVVGKAKDALLSTEAVR